jgi:PKD repeat protein
MERSLNVIIVVVILVVVIGAGIGAFYYLADSSDSDNQPDDTPDEKNRKPVAFFKGNTSGIVGQTLYFDANGSKDNDGYIVAYEWDFGDGGTFSSGNSTVANNTFYTAGTFRVNLTVRDNMGASDSYSQDVTVRPQDFQKSQSTVLLERIGINAINETFPIEIFVVSLQINISFTGAASGGLSISDAELEVILYDPMGIIIENQTKGSRFNREYINFFFDDPLLLINGDYELVATCTQGALYIDYEIMVRY